MSADQDQKTVPATQKRIQDFRKQGKIALSRDLTSIATFAGGAAVGLANAQASLQNIGQLFARMFGGLHQLTLNEALPMAGVTFAGAIAPTCIGALGGYLAATVGQLGFPPAFMKPKFDLTKLASPQAVMELLSPKKQASRGFKALAKLIFVGGVAAMALRAEWDRFSAEPVIDPSALTSRILAAVASVTIYAGFALGALAAVDYLLAKRRMNAEMKMTPEELKREMREQEGDPMIKQRRRRRMRELAKRRLTAAVKSSDVVIVNPTEFAVALRYRSKKDRAPRVVAKGKGAAAEHIRNLARSAGVPIVPNIPLARFLFKAVQEGREVPANVFQAVAEILGYVYRLQKRGPR